jgi:hypothetical protein
MELKWCSAHRMAECQSRCMESLSGSSPSDQVGSASIRPRDPAAATPAIDRVAHDWVTHVLQVNPNLVGSAGVQLQTEQVHALESRHHGRLSLGGPAFRGDYHSLPVGRVTGDGRLDPKRLRTKMAPGECGIGPADPARGDGRSQPPVCQVSLGDQHQARRVSVQPVDDAGSPFRTTGERRAPRDERVDQGVVPVSRRRMHDQSRRFIDDCKVLILEDDGERNRTRLNSAGRLMLGET